MPYRVLNSVLHFVRPRGPCLVRAEGNDSTLKEIAIRNVSNIAAGHTFVILIKEAFPVNVLNSIKACPEVCSIFLCDGKSRAGYCGRNRTGQGHNGRY